MQIIKIEPQEQRKTPRKPSHYRHYTDWSGGSIMEYISAIEAIITWCAKPQDTSHHQDDIFSFRETT